MSEALRFGAHDVACSRCGAKPGLFCRRELTRRPMMGYHRERWRALDRARWRIRAADRALRERRLLERTSLVGMHDKRS